MTATTKGLAPAGAVRARPRPRSSWLPVTTLITLGLLPVIASRLAAMATGRLSASGGEVLGGAIPLLIHVTGATVFVVLGAFQFAPLLRRKRPRLHRWFGRVVFTAGMAASLSGLWINQFGQRYGDLLYVFRLAAGVAMAASLVLGLRAILRRKIPQHRAWMIRAYALGLGAATQIFTLGFGKPVFGDTELSVALLNLTGWAVNLAIAEMLIARGTHPNRPPKRVARALSPT